MILICFNVLLLPSLELHRRVPLWPYLRHAWSWPDLHRTRAQPWWPACSSSSAPMSPRSSRKHTATSWSLEAEHSRFLIACLEQGEVHQCTCIVAALGTPLHAHARADRTWPGCTCSRPRHWRGLAPPPRAPRPAICCMRYPTVADATSPPIARSPSIGRTNAREQGKRQMRGLGRQ